MTETIRKQRSGDQLTPGDWLAPGQISDGAAEVLYAISYLGVGGTHVRLVGREQGKKVPFTDVLDGAALYDLASDEDLAELRAAAERAAAIADIRALADWLEANPWVPMPNFFDAAAHLDERHLGGPSAAKAYATVREVAERVGVKPDEHLNDRTVVDKAFGRAGYKVIAWHEGGRPVEPKAAAEHEQISGWGPGVGACGVACACGVTYDGFDSLTQASELLARHIAEPAPVPSGAVADRRSCVDPGDQEHDHEMCRDAVAESAGAE